MTDFGYVGGAAVPIGAGTSYPLGSGATGFFGVNRTYQGIPILGQGPQASGYVVGPTGPTGPTGATGPAPYSDLGNPSQQNPNHVPPAPKPKEMAESLRTAAYDAERQTWVRPSEPNALCPASASMSPGTALAIQGHVFFLADLATAERVPSKKWAGRRWGGSPDEARALARQIERKETP